MTWERYDGGARPWPPQAPAPEAEPQRHGIDVPASVVRIAILAMVGGYALSIVGAILGSLAVRTSAALAVVVSTAALSSVLLGTCRWVCRRHGTGSVRRDLGLVFDRRDPLRAVGYAVAARLGVLIVSIVLFAIHEPLVRGNLEGLDLRKDVAASIALAVAAVGVAPVVEELFFRGLLLRALQSRVSYAVALGGQAGLFGMMHAGGYGLGNVGVVVTTAVIGLVLGHVAHRQGRLGTGVLTHAVHNGASLLLVLALTP